MGDPELQIHGLLSFLEYSFLQLSLPKIFKLVYIPIGNEQCGFASILWIIKSEINSILYNIV